MIGHLADDIVEIVPGIDVMVPACGQQGAYDGHVPGSLVVAAEEVVLPVQCDWPDFVLGKVVVRQQPSVLQIAHHVVPSRVGIGDGLAYLRALVK